MARRNAQQPITYIASYASEPMTPEAFSRVQRNWARMLAQTVVARPDLLGMEETEAGLFVPSTFGMEMPGEFLLPDELVSDTIPLLTMTQDVTEAELLMAFDTAARQGRGFRSAWVQWLSKKVATGKDGRVFSIPMPGQADQSDKNTMIYRATHPHDRPYYQPRGEWFRQYAKQSKEILSNLRRTA